MRLAAFCLLFGALLLARRDVRGDRRGGGRHPLVRRVCGVYDRSRAGRRLAARLWRAQVHLSPSAWRSAQALIALPAVVVLSGLGVGMLPAIAAVSSAARLGGSVLLWLRRRAAASALDAATPFLCRALATELAEWGSGTQAIASAASRCIAGDAGPMAVRVLQGAAARVLLGGDAATSLNRAMADAVVTMHPTSSAARLAVVFALHRHDASATARALDRLAAALEEETAVRSDVRAAVAEVRMSAVAVPLIAAGTLAMLLASDPPALAVALSLPLLPMLGVAAALVAGASVAVRRLVSV